MSNIQTILSHGRPLVVGTLHEAKGISLLKTLASRRRHGVDLLEVRLDCIGTLRLPAAWPLPVIATARHPREGGGGNLSSRERGRLLLGSLPWASALDIELRSARSLGPVIASAHQHGLTVIISHHDFAATPTLQSLQRLASAASDAGADLFKVATMLRDQRDLLRLIELQSGATRVPVTAMGMGPAGRFSRLVLSGFGAPLCYGWLGKPQVSGQWPALELAELLARVLPA